MLYLLTIICPNHPYYASFGVNLRASAGGGVSRGARDVSSCLGNVAEEFPRFESNQAESSTAGGALPSIPLSFSLGPYSPQYFGWIFSF